MTKTSQNTKLARAVARRSKPAQARASVRRKSRVPRPVGRRGGGLDTAGLAYARLLNDPCHAELAEPIYMATGTGYLTRVVQDLTFSTDSGVLFLCPANWGTSGNGSVYYATSAGAGTAAGGAVTRDGPGNSFLSGVAGGVRPVAACITSYYAGTESLRAGSISQAQMDGQQALTIVTSTPIPDSIGPFFATEDRTPGTSLETKWAPGALDGDWSIGGNAYWSGGHGAVGVLWRSLGGQAVKFRLTVVYEWKPTQGEGLPNEPARGSKSANTVDQVVGFLAGLDPMWGLSRPGRGMATVGGDLIESFGKLALPVARNFALRAATGLLAI